MEIEPRILVAGYKRNSREANRTSARQKRNFRANRYLTSRTAVPSRSVVGWVATTIAAFCRELGRFPLLVSGGPTNGPTNGA